MGWLGSMGNFSLGLPLVSQPLANWNTVWQTSSPSFVWQLRVEIHWQACECHARCILPHLPSTDCQLYLETPHSHCCQGHHPSNFVNIFSVLIVIAPTQQTLRFCAISWYFLHLYQLCNWGASSNNPSNTNHIHGVLWPMVFHFGFKWCDNQLSQWCNSTCCHAAYSHCNFWQNRLPSHCLQWLGCLGG